MANRRKYSQNDSDAQFALALFYNGYINEQILGDVVQRALGKTSAFTDSIAYAPNMATRRGLEAMLLYARANENSATPGELFYLEYAYALAPHCPLIGWQIGQILTGSRPLEAKVALERAYRALRPGATMEQGIRHSLELAIMEIERQGG